MTKEERQEKGVRLPTRLGPKTSNKIGRSPNYVDSVGLGNLRVINANGYTDV